MRPTFLTIVLLSVLSPAAFAQRSQVEIAVEVISSMDRNGDGRLEAGEIPARSRAAVGKLAREAELDLAKPLSIDRLKRQLAKRQKQEEKQQRQEPGGEKTSQPNSGEGDSGIQGFGRDSTSASVAGFGTIDNRTRGTAGKNDFRQTGASDSERAADNENDDDNDNEKDPERDKARERVRRYAEGLLKRHDANKNGVLDKDEWSKMKGNPAASDTNKDGRLSVEELTVRLMDYGKTGTTESGGKRPGTKSKKSGKRWSRNRDDSRKSYRFLTPTERVAEALPTSLRDWFLRNDKNGDGQIAMSEFASIWSRAKAVDFASYDQNNDGVITPREYLRVKTGVATNN